MKSGFLAFVLGVILLAQTLTPQQQVVAVYPQAFCTLHVGDDKYKVFSSPTNRTPIGYGTTSDDAWADAANRLPQPS